MGLSLEHIEKVYGGRRVLADFSLTLEKGEFLAVLGPSGCGKSTFLRIAGGLEPPDGGSVMLDGIPVHTPGGRIMMLFQDPNQLFPWMTLGQNILYAIKKTTPSLGRHAMQIQVRRCLTEVGLLEAADKYPHQLSGGMKQRGALARALAIDAQTLLLDEPFCSLDYLTRKNAQETLLKIWRGSGKTVLFVTHDIEEALTLAEKIAVFGENGRIGASFLNDGSIPGLKERLEQLLLSRKER